MNEIYGRYLNQYLRIRVINGYYFFAKLISIDENLLHFIDRNGIASSLSPSEIKLIKVVEPEKIERYFHTASAESE